MENYEIRKTEFLSLLDTLSSDVGNIFFLSYLNFLFPLNILMENVLTSKTNRKRNEFGVDFFNELALFLLTGYGLY